MVEGTVIPSGIPVAATRDRRHSGTSREPWIGVSRDCSLGVRITAGRHSAYAVGTPKLSEAPSPWTMRREPHYLHRREPGLLSSALLPAPGMPSPNP